MTQQRQKRKINLYFLNNFGIFTCHRTQLLMLLFLNDFNERMHWILYRTPTTVTWPK